MTIEIEKFSLRQVQRIKPLWQKLNTLHYNHSTHFKEHFSSYTFERRIAELSSKEKVIILGGVTGESIVGYCLCSKDGSTGEIDSLYIEEHYRKSGLGNRLIEMGLAWLESEGADKIIVSIAHGNENVAPFYEKHGFRPRLMVMSKKYKGIVAPLYYHQDDCSINLPASLQFNRRKKRDNWKKMAENMAFFFVV